MQYKHTFLFTMVLGLVWAGALFSYQNGPDPASNGIFGDQNACAVAGCHVGNPVNAGGGMLTLGGLPAQWTPGQVYPLTVTITRIGAQKYGFQLSAVSNTSNLQAGAFTATSNRVSVPPGSSIQYAQHNLIATQVAPFTGIFTMNWTAPADSSAGTVRFNLAGNAANGDINNTGDFIYTRVDLVPAASTGPPPAPPNEFSYAAVNLGGISRITDGGGGIETGYARIEADAGSTAPTGVAIFGLRQNNMLVSETGVPASPRITQGRIYAEVDGPVNTGLAFANPSDQTAAVNFFFTNSAGVNFGSGSLTIPPHGHLAKFLDQAPYNGLAAAGTPTLQGTFTFSSSVAVSVIALRSFLNEAPRGEFLTTTIPIVNLGTAPVSDISYIPHFADGMGWTTQILLVNPTDAVLAGSVQFMGLGSPTAAAAPVNVIIGGQLGSSFPYSIPGRSSVRLRTSSPAALSSGSVRVVPNAGGISPTALVVFSFKQGLFTVSEAGVQGVRGNAQRMYVETTASGGNGSIQTGVAFTNTTAAATTVSLELFNLDGLPAAPSRQVELAANGQFAGFIDAIFGPALQLPFKGILRITSGANLSAVGLRTRWNDRSEYLITTTPPSNEGGTAPPAELLFPHLVNGGGYTTQFILFGGIAAPAFNGKLQFFKTDGSAYVLTLVP